MVPIAEDETRLVGAPPVVVETLHVDGASVDWVCVVCGMSPQAASASDGWPCDGLTTTAGYSASAQVSPEASHMHVV